MKHPVFFKSFSENRNILRQAIGLSTNSGFRCVLELPSISGFMDPIQGPITSSRPLAKAAAALKACR